MNFNVSTQHVAASYLPMSAFTAQGTEQDQRPGQSQEQSTSACASALRPLSELLKLMGSPETSLQTDSASPLQVSVRQVRARTRRGA